MRTICAFALSDNGRTGIFSESKCYVTYVKIPQNRKTFVRMYSMMNAGSINMSVYASPNR